MRLTVQREDSKKRILMACTWSMLWMCLILLSMWSASYSLAQSEKPAVPSLEQNMEEKWGISPLSVRTTAEGFFLDFRYRIIDAEKAAPLFSPKIKPLLISENTGAVMAVPSVPKVGSMRSTRKPLQGRNYVILFANPNNHIKPGHKVTVVIGDYRAEHLIVEGEESIVSSRQSARLQKAQGEFTDPKQPVEARHGHQFVVVLESNHTTGYRWEISDGADKSVVELVGSEYRAPDTGQTGAGGREVWTFQAKNPGKTTVRFKYVRPWEKDVSPAKVVSFDVVVK